MDEGSAAVIAEAATERREVAASAGLDVVDVTLGEESQDSSVPEPVFPRQSRFLALGESSAGANALALVVHPAAQEVVGRGAYTPMAWADRRDASRTAFQLDDGAEEARWSRVRNAVEMADRFFTYTREAFAEVAPDLQRLHDTTMGKSHFLREEADVREENRQLQQEVAELRARVLRLKDAEREAEDLQRKEEEACRVASEAQRRLEEERVARESAAKEADGLQRKEEEACRVASEAQKRLEVECVARESAAKEADDLRARKASARREAEEARKQLADAQVLLGKEREAAKAREEELKGHTAKQASVIADLARSFSASRDRLASVEERLGLAEAEKAAAFLRPGQPQLDGRGGGAGARCRRSDRGRLSPGRGPWSGGPNKGDCVGGTAVWHQPAFRSAPTLRSTWRRRLLGLTRRLPTKGPTSWTSWSISWRSRRRRRPTPLLS